MAIIRRTNLAKSLGSIVEQAKGLASSSFESVVARDDLPLPPAFEAERHVLRGEGDRRISYYADATKPGRPIVLIHGIHAAASAYDMRPLFEHYRKTRAVFAIDMPGFGFSGRRRRDYTPEVYTNAILDLLRDLAITNLPPDVVTHSLSSEFAARGAHLNPELFHSLTFISPTGFEPKRSRGFVGRSLADLAWRVLNTDWVGRSTYDVLVTRPSIYYFLRRSFHESVDRGLQNYCFATAHQPGAYHAPIAFMAGRLFTPNVREDLYAKVRVPVLVIYDKDPYSKFDELESFADRNPHWRAVRVGPSMGMPQFELPESTFAAMDAFWFKEADQQIMADVIQTQGVTPVTRIHPNQ